VSEHRDVREALELAALEPGGMDRLEAGDTADAAAIVGHLAGCPDCLEEMARLRRTETLLRPVVAEAPDPALRARTLAYVRELGVPRGGEPTAALPADASTVSAPGGPAGAEAAPAPPAPAARPRRRLAGLPAWAASLAAVLVVGLVVGRLVGGVPAGGDDAAAALEAVTRETAALEAAGDARAVVLVDATGAPGGTLVLSPSVGRVVVTAAGLPAPAEGATYRCWVEVGRARVVLGEMRQAGDAWWWSGDVALPAELPAGVRYGVSLDEGASGFGSVVLTGEL
jgi:hypothetical protein